MSLSKDDFEYIKAELSRYFGRIELLIDGYKVTLCLERVSAFKNVIMTYVDGKFAHKWSNGNHTESKFLRLQKNFVWKTKDRKRMKRMSKKMRKELGVDPDKQFRFYTPQWTSFRTLFAHLKQFEDIKLIREEEG